MKCFWRLLSFWIVTIGWFVTPSSSYAAEWTAVCDENTSRCVAQSALSSEGTLAATFGLQVSKDGTDAVVFVATPLGIALKPSLRLRSGTLDFNLAFEVCFPDGCRAIAALTSDQLQSLFKLTEVDLLVFPYGEAQPSALVVPLVGLKEAFGDKVSFR